MQSQYGHIHRLVFDNEDLDTGTVTPGSWRSEDERGLLDLQCIPSASQEAKEIRKEIGRFFISEGKYRGKINLLNYTLLCFTLLYFTL